MANCTILEHVLRSFNEINGIIPAKVSMISNFDSGNIGLDDGKNCGVDLRIWNIWRNFVWVPSSRNVAKNEAVVVILNSEMTMG